jgi:hypothetical protein
MRKLIFACVFSLMAAAAFAASTPRCFELRTYYAAPGKLDDLNARFRNHTLQLFEKHGISNLGYWMPIENPENQLIYLLAFPSREAARKSWRAFGADPEWKKVVEHTEANGRLVTKVESVYLTATDYSPEVKPNLAAAPRTFELRTYRTPPGKLDALHARFRKHTTRLFAKHGLEQIGYWVPTDREKGADNTLMYILAHQSREAAEASFKAFRADPDWIAAKAASEKEGSLTLPAPQGVRSVFMKPTDYSPMK